ncbi:MAG: M15 family metallopeptidase [Janthinobacterium lividum]
MFFQKKSLLLFSGILFFCALGQAQELPKGFVYLHQIDDSILQKMDFSTSDNFVGIPIEGYHGSQIICTKAAADSLKKVQYSLQEKYPHYVLQVMDAYRPAKGVWHIKRWADNLHDQGTKAKYYPDIDKKEVKKFMASKNSPHSRGSTVDVAIIDTTTGKSVDYGPKKFGKASHFDYPDLTQMQRDNRLMLRRLMTAQGFKSLNSEFWHFTLAHEPFPHTYFDFDIVNAK